MYHFVIKHDIPFPFCTKKSISMERLLSLVFLISFALIKFASALNSFFFLFHSIDRYRQYFEYGTKNSRFFSFFVVC